ncbi:MAG: pyridoxal 5'-phosphate synthase glutaminase subunit PdxT [Candidatus Lambdaproteobacteria bacterium]|nr:pyridoxal 5'-phosphate synthase glutaminase subunit PdxT [Candidatus Lambdaproteobacteria bacterium]
MRIGILALQGAVTPHLRLLERLGEAGVPVRRADELAACDGLIMPGGESSTMLNLIHHYGLWQPLADFAQARSVWGVCAGSILMASTVTHPTQESFGMIEATLRRNAYGRQNESFIACLPLRLPGQPPFDQECVFIRAPRVERWSPKALVLGEYDAHPIALRAGRHLLTTFHPELGSDTRLHEYFLTLCGAQAIEALA